MPYVPRAVRCTTGNLQHWSVAGDVRPSVRGVGFVVSDPLNMPGREEMREIVRGCCMANATLYVVESKGGLRITPMDCNGTGPSLLNSRREHRPFRRAHSCARAHNHNHSGRASTTTGHPNHLGGRATAMLRNLTGELSDETNQRKHYLSPELLQRIDLGLVWQAGRQKGGALAVQNRPPTRMHWWWSHAIPVIGYPTEAYLDAARRIGYPTDLLNLTGSRSIQDALQRLAPPEERRCLQSAASHGAIVSSPSYSSLELLAAICAVASRCGRRLT